MVEIVITGSRGFIGTNVRKGLQQEYEEIDLSLGKNHSDLIGHTGTLIYLSAWNRESESYFNPVKYIDNNLRDLAFILTNNNFDRIIFPSTTSIYNKKGELEPSTIYGITKLAGEQIVKLYAKECWILRIANPYGEYDRRSVVFKLKQCKQKNEIFTIYDNRQVVKDFFHVDHIVQVINNILNGYIQPGTYNVGSGRGLVVADFLVYFCEKQGIQYKYESSPIGISQSEYIPTENLLLDQERDIAKEWAKLVS